MSTLDRFEDSLILGLIALIEKASTKDNCEIKLSYSPESRNFDGLCSLLPASTQLNFRSFKNINQKIKYTETV